MPRDPGESAHDPFESPLAPESSVAQRVLPRIACALAAGAAVTVAAVLCAWLQLRGARQFRDPPYHEEAALEQLQALVDDYQKATGELPAHLADTLKGDNTFRIVEPDHVADYSGAIYLYRRTNAGYELLSLGADGRPGGVGLDADFYNDGHFAASPRITLRQFATAKATSSVRFFSVLAGVVVGFACLRFNFVELGRDQPAPRLVLWTEVFVTTAMAAVAAFFMSVIHIPSGH